MSNIISWIKSNLFTVLSIFITLGCIGYLALLTMQGAEFRDKLMSREDAIKRINALTRTRVTIPPEKPEGPPRRLSITVNRAAIDKLENAYERMDEEYSEIFQLAVQINKGSHVPMLDGLFPTTNDSALPFTARNAYRDAFPAMLSPYAPNTQLPRLNAGMPPSPNELNQKLKEVDDTFRSNQIGLSAGADLVNLSPADKRRLEQQRKDGTLTLIKNRARSVHLYADNDPLSDEFPFHIGAWVNQSTKPEFWQMWEGQMGLWVQQDIVQAIANANRVSDPKFNVINAPVKRLIRIQVLPGYVGIHTDGTLAGGSSGVQDPTRTMLSAVEGLNLGNADTLLPENFAISPSGRRSNAIYDVVHAELVVHADYQKLPALFESLAQVNFMTVLHMQINQVDEYEVLRRGFLYGDGDIVEARLLIETLWLREWTEPLMPDDVREYMGLERRDASEEN